MAVGTNIGKVYNGQQGVGLATTLGNDRTSGALANMAAQKKAAKAKDAELGAKQTLDVRPDEVWHYYSAGMNDLYEGWVNKGAEVMTDENVNNLWKSATPDAVEWQLTGARIKAGTNNINQAKELYDKAMGDIGTRGDEYTDKYKSDVRNFAVNHSLEDLVSGKFNFPQAEFKTPAANTFKNNSTILADAKVNYNTDLLSPDDLRKTAVDILNNPAYYENGHNPAMNQLYSSIDPLLKKHYEAKGEEMGTSGEAEFYVDYLDSRQEGKTVNMLDKMLDLASSQPMVMGEVEDESGVTVKSKRVADENKMKREVARSTAIANMGQVRKDVKAGFYGDPNKSIEDNIDAAVDYYAPQIRFAKEYSKRRESDSLYGKVDVEKSFDTWYANLTSGESMAINNAADALVGVEMPDGTKIEKSVYYSGSKVIMLQTTGKSKYIEKVVGTELDQLGDEYNIYEKSFEAGKSYYPVFIDDISNKEFWKDLHHKNIVKTKKGFTEDYREVDILGMDAVKSEFNLKGLK